MALTLNGVLTAPTEVATGGTVGVLSAEAGRYSAFWRSFNALRLPSGTRWVHAVGIHVAENRNALAEHAEGDWLFTVDDDVVLRPGTLLRLIATMERGGWDVVVAHALRRAPPYDSLVYLDDPLAGAPPWRPDARSGQLEIRAAGLPAALIHRRVFAALERPYFRCGQVDKVHLHEDVDFFARVHAAGLRCCVDLDTPVGHLSTVAVWPTAEGHPALVGPTGEVVAVDRDQVERTEKQPTLAGC